MLPYYLLTRDSHHYERFNAHVHHRAPVNRPTSDVSDMISTGTLHTVNALERGWSRLATLIKG